MKRHIALLFVRVSLLLCAAVSFLPASAQAQSARMLEQAALESLLAPIALYPDDVVRGVLAAAYDPARLDALPYPELRERMLESPDWTHDLAQAYLWQQSDVWRAVHALRLRAGSQGYPTMAVQPVAPGVYYAPYYDPLIVYGPAIVVRRYRPVYWRPWPQRPLVVASDSHGAARSRNGPPSVAAQMQQGHLPSPAARMQQQRPAIHQPAPQPREHKEHKEHRERRGEHKHRQ